MRRSRFTEKQIMGVSNGALAGVKIRDWVRKREIGVHTLACRSRVIAPTLLLHAGSLAQAEADPAAALGRSLAEAEGRLAAGDLVAAERLYRGALFEGLLLLGTLDRLEGRVEDARRDLGRASAFVPDDPRAALSSSFAEATGQARRELARFLTSAATRRDTRSTATTTRTT